VPYSEEFRALATNEALLRELVGLKPAGGTAGQWIEAPGGLRTSKGLLAVDPFRHDLVRTTTSRAIWHLLVLGACCLFFFDVAIAPSGDPFRVAYGSGRSLRNRWIGQQSDAGHATTIRRLQSRKAEVVCQVEQQRASTHFEAPVAPSRARSVCAKRRTPSPACRRRLAPRRRPRRRLHGTTSEREA